MPLERFIAASQLIEVDRVPVAPFITGHYTLWFAGISENKSSQYWGTNYRKKISAQLKVVKSFGSLSDVMIWPGVWADFGVAVELSALGAEVKFSDRTPPFPEPFLNTPEDIERFAVPDPDKDGLMPIALETCRYISTKLSESAKRKYGYGQWVFALGPSDIAGLAMGYDRFLAGIYRNPDLIHKVMRVAEDTSVQWVEAQRNALGSDLLTYISGDTDCFLNPKQFEIFSFPHINHMCTNLRRKGNVVLYHNDGNTSHLLNRLAMLEANMFNYGQNMRTETVRDKIGNKMGLVGGLHSLDVLLRGKASSVKEESKRAIDEGGERRGFVLSNEGGMASKTPWKNIMSMIESAAEY